MRWAYWAVLILTNHIVILGKHMKQLSVNEWTVATFVRRNWNSATTTCWLAATQLDTRAVLLLQAVVNRRVAIDHYRTLGEGSCPIMAKTVYFCGNKMKQLLCPSVDKKRGLSEWPIVVPFLLPCLALNSKQAGLKQSSSNQHRLGFRFLILR